MSSIVILDGSTGKELRPIAAPFRQPERSALALIEANDMVVFERRAALTIDRYADQVAEWIAGGAMIVGGCCDMYPEPIAALGRFR